MATIQSLKLKNIRNITDQYLVFSPQINLIIGANGSGKTSLLEAISIIGRGRSFRSARSGSVISFNQPALELFAKTYQGSLSHHIGIRKTAGKTHVKIDGIHVNRLSQLARTTPIQILTPRSHEIIELGPEYRRRFFDWGVFHVEHQYQHVMSRYHKILMQRNAALKKRVDFGTGWEVELATVGEQINEFRKSYFLKLSAYFEEALTLNFNIGAVTLEWKQGWTNNQSLSEVLDNNKKSDKERGYTQAGPHRADLDVFLNGINASKTASRGQQKIIICALHLAQASLLKETINMAPIILIDDLASELDSENRQRLLNGLNHVGCQLFITGTGTFQKDNNIKQMFHVEQGVFRNSV